MKIKELKKTVNVSWSPAEQYPIYLAAGSAAQQLDASFSSSSQLELYSLNLEDPGLDLELKSSLQTQHKFHKVVWSGAGTIVGGCDGGLLEFYNVEKLLKSSSDALIGSSSKHTGQVSALDVNPYQKNLLASGASDSEIFIWDLNNTAQPMAPGNRSQPHEHVQGVAWNQQVQHILGSTFATRCVVWDLRKNEPIMKLSDSGSRTRWRSLAWHPSVATQLCIASEEDQTPVIQLWDLRLAASPLATLSGHHLGVLALSWCHQDPSLLLSAGKDGRVLAWNPNNTQPGGELLAEVSSQSQWVFSVSWSPRDPSLLTTASFDQQLQLHSLLGGCRPETTTHAQSNIMESFGGVDSFNQLPAVTRAPLPAQPSQQLQLPRPPKWLQRPLRARFGFGGKLVTFDKCPQEAGSQKMVYISQVVSDPDIVERAAELDAVMGSSLSQDPQAKERLAEYCRERGDAALDQNERYTWFFLRANFLPNFRAEALNLLGYKQDEIPSKFKGATGLTSEYNHIDNNVESITSGVAGLSRGESTETDAELSTDTSTDLSDAHTLIERKLSNVDTAPAAKNVVIPNGEDSTSLICRALVCGNLEEAVELCLDAKRIPDALVIASLSSPDLLLKVQKYYLNSTASSPVSLLAHTLLLARWDALAAVSSASWRDALALTLTHCDDTALTHYCEQLGDKLSMESDPALSEAATICYLCSMSTSPLVARWRRSVTSLARLTERALVARRAAAERGRPLESGGKLDSVLNEYALRLAAQGCLQSALNSLQGVVQSELRDRLMVTVSQGQYRRASGAPQAPSFPSRQRSGSQPGAHAHKHRHHVAHSDVTNTYNTVQPSFDQQSPWQQASVPHSMPGYSHPQQQPQPASLPPGPQLAQPARPGSVGPHAGGLPSKSKYKVDPSVQSAPQYGQYSFTSPAACSPQYPYSSAAPDQHGVGSQPLTQQPMSNAPLNPLSPAPLTTVPTAATNGYYSPAPASVPAVPAHEAPYRPAPPGWNDPPMLTSKPKPKQEVQAQAPITHPLFGAEPPQHIPLQPTAPGQQPFPGQQFPGQQQYPGQQQQFPGQQQQFPGQQQPFPGQQQQFPGQQQFPAQQQGYVQQVYNPQAVYPQQTESPAPPVAAPAPEPVQKGPIPEEHAIMQTVFDDIRTECSNRASNPQMKRKLDDVQKRLENLYDLLRDYRLSETALNSLHTCVQCAQSGDHERALHVATSLATGTDFASVASFLPSLKMLLQLASQLQVYVR